MPIGTSSERVALIRVGMDTGSAEQGAKNLASYFEEADKAAKKLEEGADNAGAGLEGLGESGQKLSVLVGQQGLAGDLMDVYEGLEGVSAALGPVGTGAAVAAASVALLAAGAAAARQAMYDLTQSVVDADEAVGRKLSPAIEDAKATMDGWDGASRRTSRTITETLAPAFKTLSELFAGIKADLASMLQSMIDFGARAYDLTQPFSQESIDASSQVGRENKEGWNTLRRMTLAMVSGGTTEVSRAMGGNLAGLLYDRWMKSGEQELSLGLYDTYEGDILKAAQDSTGKVKYLKDYENNSIAMYGPTPQDWKDIQITRANDAKAEAEAKQAASAAAQAAAKAEQELTKQRAEALKTLQSLQAMQDDLTKRGIDLIDPRLAAAQTAYAKLMGQSGPQYMTGESPEMAAFRRDLLSQQVTVQPWNGWITGDEWSTETMSAEQRRGYLRMAAGQSATPDYSRMSAAMASGAQGFASATSALSGGVGGLGSALSAAGPYGMAAAAGLAILEDPKGLLHGAREIQRLVEHLPERIGTIIVDVAPKIIKMLPEVMADIATMMVIELPRAIADAIQRAWHDMTHRSDRERAQARRTPWYDRTWVRLAAGMATAGASELALAGVRAADNSRNARSSAPRRPDWGSMQLGPRAPVFLTAGVTDDSARAIRRKLATTARGGGR